MSRISTILALSASLLLGGLSRPAHAQWAVVDVGAIAQLVRQVATRQQQRQNAEQQLGQAREQYSSMTGGRGMQNLLGRLNRNHLPPHWGELAAAQAEEWARQQSAREQVVAGIGNLRNLPPLRLP